jgi:hypothetical protein
MDDGSSKFSEEEAEELEAVLDAKPQLASFFLKIEVNSFILCLLYKQIRQRHGIACKKGLGKIKKDIQVIGYP